MSFENLTIERTRQLLDKKEISAVELTEYYLGTIDEKDGEINAFLNVFKDEAIQMAKKADKKITEGKSGPLTGIPIAVKDLILIKGHKATGGSKILKNYVASYDATAIKRLRDQGAVFLGKTNLDEFGMGGSGENSAYGPTKNPIDTTRVPGGSSAGSASAVAAGMCLGALGTDTGGSTRQPAGFCGIVGLKPTYGAVSRYGLMPLTSSFDQIGTLARTVGDVKILHSVIAGHDPLDSTSLPDKKLSNPTPEIKDLRIGIPKDFLAYGGIDPKVKKLFEESTSWLEEQGADVREISLQDSSLALPVYYILLPAEASANLARYDGVRYGPSVDSDNLWDLYRKNRGTGFGKEVKRRIMIGTYVLSAGYFDAYYKKAKAVQALIRDEFEKAFENIDLILTPTSPTVAFKLGERADDPLQMYAADIFTVPLNVSGLPGISVPCGRVENLPVGLQMIAPWQREDILFKVGAFFEENHNRAAE